MDLTGNKWLRSRVASALRAQYVAGLLRAADMVDSRQGPGTGTAARIRELAEQAKEGK